MHKTMFERLAKGWRAKILHRLRPGRDMKELLAILGRAEAIQSEDQRRMFERLAVFHETRARELMLPRADIIALDLAMSWKDVLKAFQDTRHSFMPVYQGDIDHIRGIVSLKDVFSTHLSGAEGSLSTLLQPCLMVPESQLILGLLARMRMSGCQVAVVQDEYGGTAGLITLKDLISEIIGPFEGDEEEDRYCEKHEDGSWSVSAKMHVEDLERLIGVQLPHGDYDTVGGLITSILGRIPARGEVLHIAGMEVTILEAEPRRLRKVKVHVTSEAQSKQQTP